MTKRKRTSKIREMKEYVIRFVNRSAEQLQIAMLLMRNRYKTARISLRRKLIGILYTGEIIIKY